MKTVAVRNIERAEKAHIEELGRLGVATVHEAAGRVGLLNPSIRPIYPHAKVAGSAITVLLQPGDNWMLHVAIELCQPGDVIVAGTTTESDNGYFGDLLAISARAHGVAGLVIDAGVRDSEDLEKMGFPVFSRQIFAQGTVKETPGAVNVPIVCAGQVVSPGDAVVADNDGVVIVERHRVDVVLEKAISRATGEEAKRVRFAEGELGLDIYNMREKLAERGLVYLDTLEEYERYEG